MTPKLGRIAHALARARMLLDAHRVWPSKVWQQHRDRAEQERRDQRK